MSKTLSSYLGVHSISIVFFACSIGTGISEEPWPQVNGPHSNFSPLESRLKIVDDISDARQLWLSEDKDLGFGKGSVSGWLRNLAQRKGHPGSCSASILADGKVITSSFRPSGTVWAENQPQYKNFLNQPPKKPFTQEEINRMKQNLRILADDLLVATDMKTGKTAWKAIEKEAGLNRYMGKREGFNVSPAFHDGKVFSLGSTGMLRAYSSEDGSKIWEVEVETARENVAAAKAKALERKILPGGMGWNVSLIVADGTLIVPLFDGVDLSLRGIDPDSGKQKWELPKASSRYATPATWRYEGNAYILCANTKGEMRLLQPADGKVLWTVNGLGPNLYSLTPSSNMVFVNAGSKTPRKEGDTRFHGILAGYRMTPSSATLIWSHPDQPKFYFPTWMDSCSRRFLAVQDNRIFYYARNLDRKDAHLMILERDSGKVLSEKPLSTPAPLYWPIGNKLLMVRDGSHGDTHLGLFSTHYENVRQPGEFWSPPHIQTTAYEVLMELPIADGRIYMRTQDGRTACYDLTK